MMNRKRIGLCYGGLLLALIALLLWNSCAGSSETSLGSVMRILLGDAADETMYHIVWRIRLPRILASVVLGFLLQTFFANPIAGPFVLGISSGAKLTVALAMIFFLQQGLVMNSATMVLSAFAGALLSMGFILLLARRVHNMSLLVVGGVMVGYICSAITDFVVTFADDANIVNLHNWSQGSFSGTSWSNVRDMAMLVLVLLILAFLLSKPIGAYQMGESYARSMGVNVRRFRVELILLSSLLSACVTAFAGPISFVGIAVPHLVKSMLKTAKPLVVIPACFLGGAVFCLFCDLLARTMFAPTELSISSVTAVFGAPVVIAMMISRKRQHFQGG